jgi:hypothetical protein
MWYNYPQDFIKGQNTTRKLKLTSDKISLQNIKIYFICKKLSTFPLPNSVTVYERTAQLAANKPHAA